MATDRLPSRVACSGREQFLARPSPPGTYYPFFLKSVGFAFEIRLDGWFLRVAPVFLNAVAPGREAGPKICCRVPE